MRSLLARHASDLQSAEADFLRHVLHVSERYMTEAREEGGFVDAPDDDEGAEA